MNRFALILISLTAGCSMAPKYVQPDAPVPPAWPVGDAYLRQSGEMPPVVSYRDLFTDSRLQQIIEQALLNNRDLRIAAANIASARAQYRVNRANILPQMNTSAGYTYSDNATNRNTGGNTGFSNSGSRYTADVGTTAFELDLFGRLRSLSDAALQRYFGTEAAARSTRLTLVGDIADAWLTYAADQSLLKIAQDTATSAERSVKLTRLRLEGGIAPRTDVRQAEQVLATAQADLAEQRTAIAQDINALQLLVGAPVDPTLLPPSIEEVTGAVLELPAGLDSSILLRRPDVMQAEYELRAANAEIGAARAAMFPRISLTGLASLASTALSSLFTGGAFSYSAGADVSYSIFSGGAARAGVAQSKAQRDAALATYEKAIQSAFREVADALARRGTINDQFRANRNRVEAAADTYRLTDARYRGGIDTFLSSLDAQRSLYSARRSDIATQLVRASNLVSLYRALGGDTLIEAQRQ
ncbi:efflux transporter outer membrane subunit [Sphingobium sp. BS19]|uniref:efflux transporter outer membrane subunit n=1 Tax=Sphingobium sp. BS19 TaxID=3018973 RepID=UPI0022EEF1B1|nr:efflux transporter outer membrane subunit [Sphingobium sp. BS19]GLI96583.1 adeC/adeK/oprM family multidrug efflux complex outer membrane factor [Sphingobium sp. BS19]